MCELVPVNMPTRAPIPGDTRNIVTIRENITEPIAISTRDVVKGTVKKLIWWFVGRVKRGSQEKVEGTQMAGESYESHFLDVGEALDRLSFPGDREVATLAARIVEDTEKESGEEDLGSGGKLQESLDVGVSTFFTYAAHTNLPCD